MVTRIAFLRAVNLGARTVRNARLVELFAELGYSDVWTYINSGNVVFSAVGARDALQRQIGSAVERDVGFEVTTFVRTVDELRKLLDQRPFELQPGDTYFMTFLAGRPTPAQRRDLEELSNDIDTLVVHGRDVHWRMHGKSTDSMLAKRHWEQILGRNSSTSRNTTMLTKLLQKIEARQRP
ncbi:MAG TPA: DUF1697 domain-containing protein [Microlunatus sp.]|nr:DUF1697 domain-containing protein [Microlunatus sp.]